MYMEVEVYFRGLLKIHPIFSTPELIARGHVPNRPLNTAREYGTKFVCYLQSKPYRFLVL